MNLQCATIAATAFILLASCDRDKAPTSSDAPAVPAIPEIASVPYENAADVWISARYKPDHLGIDFSATKEIPVRAPGGQICYDHTY
jgi:hypothetical protein